MSSTDILLVLNLIILITGFVILGLLVRNWIGKKSEVPKRAHSFSPLPSVYASSPSHPDHPMVHQRWRNEVKRTIELQCLSIRNAVAKQTIDIHQTEMELAPKSFLFDDDILKEVYQPEQLDILNEFLSTFQKYLELHWYTKERRMKTVFTGRISNIDSEAGRMVYRSKLVVNEFDRLYQQLMNFKNEQ
ncbi:hypothetical protein [Salisediminibacterium beveridgei]|uniref:Uncharacterized protein n=1 Tax=Salisediminibacterium beveridgei TaxID=632773 RepID=A0A1D7QUR6_9BACI|nr:hypothetical protein [Salisediminibacterium beveridgei]AOM82756.1 hypothetical protein BBEV_1393 [Salisediminibacterium beveridgei]